MSRRTCIGPSAATVWLFEKAYCASRVRTVWPFDPGDSVWKDRELDRLFEGAVVLDGKHAVERSLAFGASRYKPLQTAELLRWAEQEKIVERIEVNRALAWQRIRHGVSFIPRIALSADVRTAQQNIGGPSFDFLVSREADLRARKLSEDTDRHLADLCRLMERINGTVGKGPQVIRSDGLNIDDLWQLREELEGGKRGMPLYRLIQVVDQISRRLPPETCQIYR